MPPRAPLLGLLALLSLGSCSDDQGGATSGPEGDCAAGQLKLTAELRELATSPFGEPAALQPLVGRGFSVAACVGPLTATGEKEYFGAALAPDAGAATLAGADLSLAPAGFVDAFSTLASSSFRILNVDAAYQELQVIVTLKAQADADLWEIELQCFATADAPIDPANVTPVAMECKPEAQYGGEVVIRLNGGLDARIDGKATFRVAD